MPILNNDLTSTSPVDSEMASLRLQVLDLQAEVARLKAAGEHHEPGHDLMEQLREANQNLLLATFGAQDLQAAAEADNLAKEEFLSMLAHELRNPLAPIMMANALIGKLQAAHPMLPKLHGIIERQSRHLTRLVEDLLDASRISSGKINLQRQPVLLAEILDSAIETSQPALLQRKQQLVLDLPDTPVVIDGDVIRLTQVFSNLLINAAKFSAVGTVIKIRLCQQADTVTVHVSDHGMGIASEFQPHIFDLFKQGPNSLDRALGGLGIGLSLVRSIVNLHGGNVQVHSAGIGLGSEFVVTLPISVAVLAPTSIALPVDIDQTELRILLIEDNVDANDMLSTLLNMEGYAVRCAVDGKTGTEMACEQQYDVIICDIGLPTMDGYEIVRQLRRRLSPAPCFIAITGYNQPSDRLRATEAGFDHFMAKPVSVEALLKVLSSCTPH